MPIWLTTYRFNDLRQVSSSLSLGFLICEMVPDSLCHVSYKMSSPCRHPTRNPHPDPPATTGSHIQPGAPCCRGDSGPKGGREQVPDRAAHLEDPVHRNTQPRLSRKEQQPQLYSRAKIWAWSQCAPIRSHSTRGRTHRRPAQQVRTEKANAVRGGGHERRFSVSVLAETTETELLRDRKLQQAEHRWSARCTLPTKRTF